MQYSHVNSSKSAVLVYGDENRHAQLRHLAENLECSISDGNFIAVGGNRDESLPDFDLLLIDLTSKSELSSEELDNISSYLDNSNIEALVWTELEQLETAYALLPISKCHFLIGASDAEVMLIMARAFRRGKMDRVYDGNRNLELGALNRISDELADFARTLARIAEKDDLTPSNLAEKPVSFRPAPAATTHPFIESQPESPRFHDPEFVRKTIKLRRLRDKFFDHDLFADPAWDILLDLYAARLEAISVSVSSLCIAAAVPSTTALRWISSMTENGLLVRRQDPKDARRVFIELSNEMVEQMSRYFIQLASSDGKTV